MREEGLRTCQRWRSVGERGRFADMSEVEKCR